MRAIVLASVVAALAIVAAAQTRPSTAPAREPRSIGVAYSDGVQHIVPVAAGDQRFNDAIRAIEARYAEISRENAKLPDGRKVKE